MYALYNAHDVAIIFTEVKREGETTIMAWPCASVNRYNCKNSTCE